MVNAICHDTGIAINVDATQAQQDGWNEINTKLSAPNLLSNYFTDARTQHCRNRLA